MKHLLWLCLLSPLAAQVPINSDVSVKGALVATGPLTGSSVVSSANGGVMRFLTQGASQASILPSADASGYTSLDILSVFSSTRLGQARLRVYGPATTDWARYSLFSHDGANGLVGTGYGGLIFSFAGAEQARFTGAGNLLLGTISDTGERLKVQGNAAISGSLSVGTTVTATSFSGNLSGNASTVTNGVYTTGSYSDPSWLTLTKGKVGLGNVENTALSTWTGSTSITTLGTISTGTVPWAIVSGKPSFTSTNTANAVVQRDASGNFAAGTITANLTGNVTGNASGSAGSVAWANVSSKPTFASTNTASAVVQRDASGNFSAGTVTAALSGNASTATALAANGANCSAGQAALGVSASGAAEGCYDPNTYRSGQINYVYGGSASTAIDATTVNNVWRAHAHQAVVTEIACWTDAGTVSLTIKDSAGNAVASALTCSTSGASTTTINGYGTLTYGEGLGFTTASVSSVKNLSVSIKYTRSY
ncbi:MAG TPA: hypothetical protein PKJ41_15465 [Bryobacteraceae bacterium]|nr:hypothetical protein [Bryobacteraceae bacterium]